jgi:hydrogenase nickel incorporation protein HypA/HybF
MEPVHEMGIALEVIDIATASIPKELPDARVTKVFLTVGRLAAVVPESLRFCFQVASERTRLAGAELVIEQVAVNARCRQCDHAWSIDTPAFRCPACDSGDIDIVSGRELDIRSIEIEENSPP